MRVTDKGQVTIPKELRERLGIVPGSEVTFSFTDDHLEIRKSAVAGRGAGIVERMRGHAGPGLSTDELMALIRGDD